MYLALVMIECGICVCLMYLYPWSNIITYEIMVLIITYFQICNFRNYHVFLDHFVCILCIHPSWIEIITYEIMVPIVILNLMCNF